MINTYKTEYEEAITKFSGPLFFYMSSSTAKALAVYYKLYDPDTSWSDIVDLMTKYDFAYALPLQEGVVKAVKETYGIRHPENPWPEVVTEPEDDMWYLAVVKMPQEFHEYTTEGPFHEGPKDTIPPDSVKVTSPDGGKDLIGFVNNGIIHFFDEGYTTAPVEDADEVWLYAN
jgi:hypothetical protein